MYRPRVELKQKFSISRDLEKGFIVSGTAKTKFLSIPSFPASPKKGEMEKAAQ